VKKKIRVDEVNWNGFYKDQRMVGLGREQACGFSLRPRYPTIFPNGRGRGGRSGCGRRGTGRGRRSETRERWPPPLLGGLKFADAR
jgi:hypothetical protein